MRKWLRKLKQISVVASLVFCVAFGALWVRTYFASDHLVFTLPVRNLPPPPEIPAGFHLLRQNIYNTLEVNTHRGELAVWGVDQPEVERTSEEPKQTISYHLSTSAADDFEPEEHSFLTRHGFAIDGWLTEWDHPTLDWTLDDEWKAVFIRWSPWPEGDHVRPTQCNLDLPLWFLALLTAIASAAAIYSSFRKRRLTSRGCCRKCGYDLRATPERCPECGTRAYSPVTASSGVQGEVAA